MDAVAGAIGLAALALIGKVAYDVWNRWHEKRVIAAALAGEIGAYITLMRPSEAAAAYRTIATLDREDRVRRLSAMPAPPTSHPVFDKIAPRIGLLSPQEALEISAFYNMVTGFRIIVASLSSEKFLNAPDTMHIGVLQYIAKALEEEAPIANRLVERLKRTADAKLWAQSFEMVWSRLRLRTDTR